MPVRIRVPSIALSFLLGILLLAGGLGLRAQAPDTLTVRHVARALQPGEVVVITVSSREPLQEVSGEAWDRSIGFRPGPDSGTWLGLVGIDLGTKAGSYAVRVSVQTRDGRELFARHALKVIAKKFPERRLSVAPRFTEPSREEQDRIAREQERLRKLYAAMTPESLWEDGFVLPVDSQVTSTFGVRRTFNGRTQSVHRGLDLRGTVGTPIVAPNAGRVALAEDLFYSGNTVIIDHGQGLISLLAHLSRLNVREGAMVQKGALVGEVGATGRVTGPHLHWTLRLGGVHVDPQSLVSVLATLAP
jgi:murein DD-endopeptidase MepM/ murein hydrolase activator NlpD